MEQQVENFIPKRRTPRRLLERKIGVLYQGSYSPSSSIEIGEGGILISSKFNLALNDLIVLTFSIPQKPLISVTASVSHKVDEQSAKNLNGSLVNHGVESNSVYGVQFNNLDIEYKRIIRKFVAEKKEIESLIESLIASEARTIGFSFDKNGKPMPTVL